MNASDYAPYLVALLAIWGLFSLASRYSRGHALAAVDDAGGIVPLSLHPVIDAALCIGCTACTTACPEGRILEMVGGKAELVDPASCIGHGACKTSCPTAAIDLVFGSAKRGVDIPQVSADFQTNIPGIYIAGELGGMGLIANAVEQGSQAIDAISKREGLHQPNMLDVVIVGAGPAGFAASLAARERRLSAVTVEQDRLGGAIAHYPRGKLIMTRPTKLPFQGGITVRRLLKEELLSTWQAMTRKTGMQIRFGQRVERITPTASGYEVETQDSRLSTRTVLLATGRRGAPRKLGVPGEDQPKVVYSLDDPAQYRGKRVLVVGGGNSALEAALALTGEPETKVTLCHRGAAFSSAKQEIRQGIENAQSRGLMSVLLDSNVKAIHAERVDIDTHGESQSLANDAVIICAGGWLPAALLHQIGIAVDTKFGTR